jgi:hypothetical protein
MEDLRITLYTSFNRPADRRDLPGEVDRYVTALTVILQSAFADRTET